MVQIDLNSISSTGDSPVTAWVNSNGHELEPTSVTIAIPVVVVPNLKLHTAEPEPEESHRDGATAAAVAPTLDPELRESVSILESDIIKTIENSSIKLKEGESKIEQILKEKKVHEAAVDLTNGKKVGQYNVNLDFVTPIVEMIPEDEKIEIIRRPMPGRDENESEETASFGPPIVRSERPWEARSDVTVTETPRGGVTDGITFETSPVSTNTVTNKSTTGRDGHDKVRGDRSERRKSFSVIFIIDCDKNEQTLGQECRFVLNVRFYKHSKY